MVTKTNMAAVLPQGSVIFADSLPEDIAHAREFWKAIDGDPLIISTLHVSGINHRFPTVSLAQKTDLHKKTEIQDKVKQHPSLINNSNEAKRRLKIEEDEYTNRILHEKKKQQDFLQKQREQRLQKEVFRTTTNVINEMVDYEDEINYSEDEAIQAMNDIDDFDRMVKLANEQRKEKQEPACI